MNTDREKEDSVDHLERVAFMSYEHENDKLDRGYLSQFRERLEGQVSALMGEKFTIFQDSTHIKTGHEWQIHIKQYLTKSTFLIPIITPHFYKSKWCRKEFEYFRTVERQRPHSQRIVPIYYIESQQMRNGSRFQPGSMEYLLHEYQYADWRVLRDYGINTAPATKRLRQIAQHIYDLYEELASDQVIASASKSLNYSGQRALSGQNSCDLDVPVNSSLGAPFDFMMLPPLSGFLGRSSEVAWIIELLTAPTHFHLVSLDGVDAIGKSSVAAQAARRLYEHGRFPDGIGVVQCTGMTDPQAVLCEALTRFDPERRPPTSNDEAGLAQEAQQLLVAKQTLIVLDDIESQLDIIRVIKPLEKAGAALLLTSRDPLPVPKNVRRTLEPLKKSEAVDLLTTPFTK